MWFTVSWFVFLVFVIIVHLVVSDVVVEVFLMGVSDGGRIAYNLILGRAGLKKNEKYSLFTCIIQRKV